MARKKSRRPDWRMIVLYIISVLIVLSMTLAYVLPGQG
jgi:hypothetical protein